MFAGWVYLPEWTILWILFIKNVGLLKVSRPSLTVLTAYKDKTPSQGHSLLKIFSTVGRQLAMPSDEDLLEVFFSLKAFIDCLKSLQG